MIRSEELHRLAEERSLAYHRAVAARLLQDPALIEEVRIRIEDWIRKGGRSAAYARQWLEILERPLPAICGILVDESETARALRQATPFAGVIDHRERWRIWREVKQRFEESA